LLPFIDFVTLSLHFHLIISSHWLVGQAAANKSLAAENSLFTAIAC
jgi:hypothetical protein